MEGTPELAVPRTRQDLRYWIACDLAAHGLGEWRAYHRLTRPVVRYQVLRRRAEYWRHGSDHHGPAAAVVAAVLARRARVAGRRLGLDVPLGTAGPGLLLQVAPHAAGTGTRVHPDARLGDHRTVPPGTVVGGGDVPVANDGRHTTMTPDQVRLARTLLAGGRLGVDEVAGAFWVTPTTLAACLADHGHDTRTAKVS